MEDVREIDEIVHPAVREVFRHMNITDGIEMHHDSDLPARSGMGSSSSFVVGLLHALHALRGEMLDKTALAKEAIHIEHNLIKENVGIQDQIMAAFGGFNLLKFETDGTFSVQPVALKKERLNDLRSHMMLFFTGIKRVASEVAAEQIRNTPDRAKELSEMRKMVDEGFKVITGSAPISELGQLMHENWRLKRSLSQKITNPVIDELYEAAMQAGAVGGKLLGAGGGGFVMMIVPPDRQQAVLKRLPKVIHIPFAFENLGSNIIFFREQAA